MQYTVRFDREVLVICISLTDNFYTSIPPFHASPWITKYRSIVSLLFYRYLPHEATQPPLAGTRIMSTCHEANRICDVSKSE